MNHGSVFGPVVNIKLVQILGDALNVEVNGNASMPETHYLAYVSDRSSIRRVGCDASEGRIEGGTSSQYRFATQAESKSTLGTRPMGY